MQAIEQESILKDIAACAALPIEEAISLPAAAYTSPEIFALEKERVFSREWICIGREDRIANEGDYICSNIADEPVFTTRSADGEIRTFSNRCRHRGTLMLEGGGNTKRVVCPYHAWCDKSADGRLISAPYMEQSRIFSKEENSLPEFRTEVWQGWVYVTLNNDLAPVAERLAGLTGLVSPARMQQYRTLIQEDLVWHTNWKCLTENFLDEYHPFMVHRETFGKVEHADTAENLASFEGDCDENHAWTMHQQSVDPGAMEIARKVFPDMEEKDMHHTLFGVFPSHTVYVGPGNAMFWLSLQAESVDRVNIRWGVSLPPNYAEVTGISDEDSIAFFNRVNGEDKFIVERLFKGLKARDMQLGPLSNREWSVWRFQNYLNQALDAD